MITTGFLECRTTGFRRIFSGVASGRGRGHAQRPATVPGRYVSRPHWIIGWMSTRVVITGGAGFLGGLLARRLLAGPISLGGAPAEPVGELILVDLATSDLVADRVRPVVSDLSALADLGEVDAV